MWICVCSFSSVLLDLSTFKRNGPGFVYYLYLSKEERNEPKQLVVSMLLYVQKSKTIGNLYTNKT